MAVLDDDSLSEFSAWIRLPPELFGNQFRDKGRCTGFYWYVPFYHFATTRVLTCMKIRLPVAFTHL